MKTEHQQEPAVAIEAALALDACMDDKTDNSATDIASPDGDSPSNNPKRARSVLNGAYWGAVPKGKRREAAFEAREKLSMMPCLLYTSPSPRDRTRSRMPSSA